MALLLLLIKLVSANCQQVLVAWSRTKLCTVSIQLKLALLMQHSHATKYQRSQGVQGCNASLGFLMLSR